jgi:hypothetical protein
MAINVGIFLWENEPDTKSPKDQRVLDDIKEKGPHIKKPKQLKMATSPKKAAWITSVLGGGKSK